MVGIITTPESEIEQKREVKLTNGSGAPTQGTTAGGFSEVVGAFVVPSDQRYGTGVTVPVQPVICVRPPWGNGVVTWEQDATANDSDKSFVTPVGKVRLYKSIHVTLATSADVGNRVLGLGVLTAAAATVFLTNTGVNHAASTTNNYVFAPFVPLDTSGASMSFGVPDLILTAGMSLRVYDISAIAAGADDMTVNLQYIDWDM